MKATASEIMEAFKDAMIITRRKDAVAYGLDRPDACRNGHRFTDSIHILCGKVAVVFRSTKVLLQPRKRMDELACIYQDDPRCPKRSSAWLRHARTVKNTWNVPIKDRVMP